MSESAITIENVSKRYRYGGTAPLSYNLRADITEWIKGSFRRGQHRHATLHEVQEKHLSESPEYFWALKDINLEIKQGEVVGIIGRNGAGKSTLLKILSRITPPTTGTITYHGRVASLLEVGTGFHRELTGRENIFLNGSILGMKRAEITRRFDEIVAFAEIDKFIDTPVKFYSSGMYVRLAFAVAAHLQPEILIVDEVLAVGDAAFQKKCLGKMGDIAKQGRTVLFVSHNMGAIRNLCGRGLVLDHGRIIIDDTAGRAIEGYFSAQSETSVGEVLLKEKKTDAFFTRVAVLDANGRYSQSLPVTEGFSLQFEFRVLRPISGLDISFSLFDRNGLKILRSGALKANGSPTHDYLTGQYMATVKIPRLFLAPGLYSIRSGLHQPNVQLFDQRDNVFQFTIVETGSDEFKYFGEDIGSVLANFQWDVVKRNG